MFKNSELKELNTNTQLIVNFQIQIASIPHGLSPLKLYQDTQHVKLAGLWLLIIITQKSGRDLKYAGHKR